MGTAVLVGATILGICLLGVAGEIRRLRTEIAVLFHEFIRKWEDDE